MAGEAHARQRHAFKGHRHRHGVRPLEAQFRHPRRVAAEQLVGAFSNLADDDAIPARELGHVVDRHADRIGERLVLQLHHRRQEVHQILLRQQPLVVLGPDEVGDHPGVVQLVLVRLVFALVPDAERLDL